jgi:hypothetical protein
MPLRNVLSALPTPKNFRLKGTSRLIAGIAIGFSLTFVAAGIAMLVGLLPQGIVVGRSQIDAGVILLFAPLCALTFAILAEAVRATLTGSFRNTELQPELSAAPMLKSWSNAASEE